MRSQLLFLLISLLVLNSESLNCYENNPRGHPSDLRVFHISSPCSPFKKKTNTVSWESTLLQDKARLQYLSSLAVKSSVPIASGRAIVQSPTYIVRANIGTPAQPMLVALDTSNDAAWVPCSGCVGCASSVLFDPSKSNSSRTLPCEAPQCKQALNPTCTVSKSCGFNMTYGGSAITASLTQDTLTLANDVIPNYTFGCINQATGTSLPAQGLMGLGRGPLSLISQTQSLYMSTFSYCLPNSKSSNFSGSLRLGPKFQPLRIKTTPLLKNPRRSSLYYVNLVGIRVGNKIVDIPTSALAFDPATGAGTIFDSGTVFTRLVEPAYLAVRDEFRRRVKNANATSLGGFDTCYSGSVVFPPVTFMFAGMNVTIPPDNLLIHSSSGNTSCLAMAAAPNNVNSVLNVIASMQQQNHRILIDLPNSRLGISRETCT
ncbi:hypothetical protein HID58_061028 [Brassica napus]|uniref:BnaC04g26330D protein n=2 Tax=Brassica napus TaxID=3708 RepID=A0A078FJM7_BRANA|nr:aspartyl protease AED3 [Brassica napus]KAH0884932.1 hypothetical protein HID58_061028 [Brassica napus]CAF1852908.1 unnamed protein product [Brassica napus]CDY13202.1 BnaC04g26330D [Brassica napus]